MQAIIERNIVIICNPLAGNGRALGLSEKISNELFRRNIRHVHLREKWPADFSEYTDVFISGGDGTLNYFINQYPEIKIPIVIFKGGSGNDFHWLLFGDKDFEQQMEIALSATPKLIDAGKCNERYFINGVGIGFDGAVAKSLNGKRKRPGKTTFLAAILKKIFFYRSREYTIGFDNTTIKARQLLIGVANGRRAGGGFHIAPEAAANDGCLDVIIVSPIYPLARLRWLPVIEKGKHLGLPFIQYSKTAKICISSNVPMQAHLDGEYYSADKLQIEILSKKFLFVY